MNKEVLVTIENADFGYYPRSKPVLTDVFICIRAGEFVVFRGSNGCGKSTLIKGLIGLALVLKGSVTWNLDQTVVGYVPQENIISTDIPYTALDIVRCAVRSSWGKSSIEAVSALESVELKEAASIRYGDLSGGQKRRVLLARALVKRPPVLILDEPTANVDIHTESIIEKKIDELVLSGDTTVIAVAHCTNFGKNARVVMVKEGRVHG